MEVKPVVGALIALAALQSPQFRAGVEAVRVDALVVDGRKPVTGLTAEDFQLRDNGIVQRIDSVAISDVPISMMIALDTSQSVAGRILRELKEGVSDAVAALRPVDRAALISFSSDVRLTMDWAGTAEGVPNALSHLRAAGSTSLWDATFTALTFSDDTPAIRRLVLIFSDGEDTSSWLARASVLEKARRTDAVVYGVEIRDASTRHVSTLQNRSGIESFENVLPDDTPFLEEVADVTGGSRFRTTDAADLRKAFSKILTEFRTRYLITYTAQGVDQAGWHALDVKLKTKHGKVSARRGYMR
jgi:Ca-activated chloride channel family protein